MKQGWMLGGGYTGVTPSWHWYQGGEQLFILQSIPFQTSAPPCEFLLEQVSEGWLWPAGWPSLSPLFYFPGANCQGRSPVGRTPLHVAAAMSRLDCISLLLNYGASINDKDAKGETPMSVARRLNRTQSERRMFLFYWLVKMGTKDPLDPVVNKAFQRVKSGFGTKDSKA